MLYLAMSYVAKSNKNQKQNWICSLHNLFRLCAKQTRLPRKMLDTHNIQYKTQNTCSKRRSRILLQNSSMSRSPLCFIKRHFFPQLTQLKRQQKIAYSISIQFELRMNRKTHLYRLHLRFRRYFWVKINIYFFVWL